MMFPKEDASMADDIRGDRAGPPSSPAGPDAVQRSLPQFFWESW